MTSRVYQWVRAAYWKLPLPWDVKERTAGWIRRLLRGGTKKGVTDARNRDQLRAYQAYVGQILAIPDRSKTDYVALREKPFVRDCADPKVLAYYLPQFHPTPENDRWWGRGITEWNNVSRAVPQFLGHYQPRLPGELGYYDLRVIDNIARQVELARTYGIYGFGFYFYWFDGVRLLDQPLDAFVARRSIDFPFCLCWANESWTRRFDGTCGEILIRQPESVASYRSFIEAAIPYMRDARYIRVGDRPVLIVYRASFVPDCANTLDSWRRACRAAGMGEPYLIGVKEHTWDADLLAHGFDAQSEFHPGTLFRYCRDVTRQLTFIREDFGGMVFDYRDIVVNAKYRLLSGRKLHRAVMPMWDNTARRNNMGMVFHGSTPELYEHWLTDVLRETRRLVAQGNLDDSFVFVNAWNEWGEGAYLEPDARFGYAYLDATLKAINRSRDALGQPAPESIPASA